MAFEKSGQFEFDRNRGGKRDEEIENFLLRTFRRPRPFFQSARDENASGGRGGRGGDELLVNERVGGLSAVRNGLQYDELPPSGRSSLAAFSQMPASGECRRASSSS